MSEETPGPTPQVDRESGKEPEVLTSPFRRNLEVFINRIDSLAEHASLAMAVISQSNKQARRKFEDFIKSDATPVEGEKDAFRIPEAKFTEFRRLQRRLHRSDLAFLSVPRGLTVALVSEFDAFMGATLKTFHLLKPDSLNASQRAMTLSELVSFGTIEAAKEHVIEKEVESFLRGSHTDQFETLEAKVGIPLRTDLPIWKDFIELTERRNLFVHNDGVVNAQYLQACTKAGFDCSGTEKGTALGVTPKYFSRAHETVYELAAKLSHVLWRKLSPEDRDAADRHLAGTLIYDLLYEKRYRLARTLADFGATFKKWGSDYFRRALIVNRAQAYVWDGQREEGLKILAAEDWSAANDEFLVCIAAVRQDFPAAIKHMKALGMNAGPKKEGFRDWPAFRELRKSKEFQEVFLELFGEPFSTVKLAASDSPSSSAPSGVNVGDSGPQVLLAGSAEPPADDDETVH